MSAVIVDYGLGNLFSIVQACRVAGLPVEVANAPERVAAASLVILPGVGAFGDAMASLRKLRLVQPLKEFAASGRPLFGICLGMQLLMDGSDEFGSHEGLGLIPGSVTRLPAEQGLKVPKVGWARAHTRNRGGDVFNGVPDGSYFYFVHSYYVSPANKADVIAVSQFGAFEYCCAVRRGPVFGVQFHPERSGNNGLQMYRNLVGAMREIAPVEAN